MFARLLFAATLIATPALAQTSGPQDEPPKRVRSVLLFGDEQCPESKDPDEIVVCAKSGESPYRIPKIFRDQPRESAAGRSWTRRMEVVEEVNRSGLPNSCSPVGIGGQTGCTRQMIRQWYQEKLDREAKAKRVP